MLYQRRQLPSTDIGAPAALPQALQGLSDASLADLSAALVPVPAAYAGQAFLPVADPAPPTPAPIISVLEFKRLFTAAERIAVRAAAVSNGQIADWIDLSNVATQVHLDDPQLMAGTHALETFGLLAAGRAAIILAGTAPS